MINNLTYAIYKWTPAMSRPAFAQGRNQGIVETFDTLRHSLDGTKAILKWRGEQPSVLAPGLILETGNHAAIRQKLKDDSSEWAGP